LSIGAGNSAIDAGVWFVLIRQTTSKSWDEDPLQKGAYAEFSPGQITTLVPELARVEGRVHFAGDQLSHRPGFMHGALASARRVVKEIVERDR